MFTHQVTNRHANAAEAITIRGLVFTLDRSLISPIYRCEVGPDEANQAFLGGQPLALFQSRGFALTASGIPDVHVYRRSNDVYAFSITEKRVRVLEEAEGLSFERGEVPGPAIAG